MTEHGVWGTDSRAVGGFGESYRAQVASGAEADLPGSDEDRALSESVRKSLALAHIDCADLRVDVRERRVTLYGSVRESDERSELESRARAVPGVVSVTNQLSVLDEVRRAP